MALIAPMVWMDALQPPISSKPRRLTVAEQNARTRELDDLRLKRPLTREERAEADSLAERAYGRVYRALGR